MLNRIIIGAAVASFAFASLVGGASAAPVQHAKPGHHAKAAHTAKPAHHAKAAHTAKPVHHVKAAHTAKPAHKAAVVSDQSFVTRAGYMNDTTLAYAKMILCQGVSGNLRSFAHTALEQHKAMESDLARVAHGASLKVPAGTDPGAAVTMKKLAKLYGDTFDHHMWQVLRANHLAAVKLYQDEIAHGQNKWVVAYAKSHLRTLQANLATINGALTPKKKK